MCARGKITAPDFIPVIEVTSLKEEKECNEDDEAHPVTSRLGSSRTAWRVRGATCDPSESARRKSFRSPFEI